MELISNISQLINFAVINGHFKFVFLAEIYFLFPLFRAWIHFSELGIRMKINGIFVEFPEFFFENFFLWKIFILREFILGAIGKNENTYPPSI